MRIVSGDFRGRTIRAPAGGEVRPTSDRVREAIFNILSARIDLRGVRVLDLFAGSGSLGFEALSRGADRVCFVDRAPGTIGCCRKNAASLGVNDRVKLVRMDVFRYLKRRIDDGFDLIFADPPYDMDGIEDLPGEILVLLRTGGVLVLEHDAGIAFGQYPGAVETRNYGRTRVSFFGGEKT